MSVPFRLNPGQGMTFPALYIGSVGSSGVPITQYLGASNDAADQGGFGQQGFTPADGQLTLYAHDPGGATLPGGGVYPIPAGKRWELPLGAGGAKLSGPFDLRVQNTGAVPLWVEVHRDLA